MAIHVSSNAQATGTNSIFRVILGSATGTMIEWYDFYIFLEQGNLFRLRKRYTQTGQC
jgi:hypothetical protein